MSQRLSTIFKNLAVGGSFIYGAKKVGDTMDSIKSTSEQMREGLNVKGQTDGLIYGKRSVEVEIKPSGRETKK